MVSPSSSSTNDNQTDYQPKRFAPSRQALSTMVHFSSTTDNDNGRQQTVTARPFGGQAAQTALCGGVLPERDGHSRERQSGHYRLD